MSNQLPSLKSAHKAATSAHRGAMREYRRQLAIWQYRDATQENDRVPGHPQLPVGLYDLNHLLNREPWEVRVARSRRDALSARRDARRTPPMAPEIEAVIRRLGRVPYSAGSYAEKVLRLHLDTVTAGCAGTGLRLAEQRAKSAALMDVMALMERAA